MPRGLTAATLDLIAAAYAILQDSQPNTVRGTCYKLFSAPYNLIPDMSKRSTDKVSRILTTARERGMIPWSWVVDEHRRIERQSSWDDPDEYMDLVLRSYRKDRWTNQPERVIVVSEKGTIGGVLRPVLKDWGVPFLVVHGFGSSSSVHELAELSTDDDKPLTLIYTDDHDPSGRWMSERDLPERLERYGGEATVTRVALTPEQIEDAGLVGFPAAAKMKDSRHPWFVRKFGDRAYELDANRLRDAVEEAILDHLDRDAWERASSTEAAEMTSLKDFLGAWQAMGATDAMVGQAQG